MNKNFDELRKEAHEFACASDSPLSDLSTVYRNKYNELIVLECLDMIYTWSPDEILDHFGIAQTTGNEDGWPLPG